uniref:AMP deaminase n=1 Tax=Trichobilharzia regenti TaxID=157069 RepID=A0AA85JZ03_TRIRE|nr:unnamed protein product [Trichobilharzia regenti]CAH8837986.1 unnamed protein product [Trichobilharzia regenti]CAH8837989.1 unnamed protein product [Trichobilharzia regenti]
MDHKLNELTENIKQRGREGAYPLFKQTGPEYVMPKFPIERKEMEEHILEFKLARSASNMDGDYKVTTSEENRDSIVVAPRTFGLDNYNSMGNMINGSAESVSSNNKQSHHTCGIVLGKNDKVNEEDYSCDCLTQLPEEFPQERHAQPSLSTSGTNTSSLEFSNRIQSRLAQGGFLLQNEQFSGGSVGGGGGSLVRRLYSVPGAASDGLPLHLTPGSSMYADVAPVIQEVEVAAEAHLESAAVEFQRVQICGDDTLGLSTIHPHTSGNSFGQQCIVQVPVDDLHFASEALIKALLLRHKYITASHQSFYRTTARYLSILDSGSVKLLDYEEKRYKTIHTPVFDHPIHPPEKTGDPFEIDYWPEPLNVKLEFHKGIMHVIRNRETVNGNGGGCGGGGVSESTDKANGEVHQTNNDHGDDDNDDDGLPVFNVPCLQTFFSDFDTIRTFVADGPLKSFCYRRLTYLASKFQLHSLLNEARESLEQKRVSHRDFYNIRKVDTHLHASSCMNQKHLLRFIKKTIRTKANVHVCEDPKTKKPITLNELIDKIGITLYDLNIDNLDVHADRNTFHRFDKFNAKYNPIGQSQLREVFLKSDNYIKGVFFAHVLKEVFSDLSESKYQNAEPRLSIYGRSINEWDNLAKWAIDCKVYSDNVRWLIQVPRLFDVYHAKGSMKYFQDIITNVFQPLFEVTANPKSHPELHAFLQYVTGFDSVDDESKSDKIVFNISTPTPDEYDLNENPPYSYYIFYMYANIAQLNQFRSHRGLNTFSFRPHSGEAGNINHLVTCFLLAESINHGLLLRKAPVLQYLYYLAQIGIAMSPLSNNSYSWIIIVIP